jgi:hypothetical protein
MSMTSFTQQSIVSFVLSVLLLLVGGTMLAWEVMRPMPDAVQDTPPDVRVLEIEELETLLQHPLLSSLVPLASPVKPGRLGNREPFTVFDSSSQ